MLVVHANWTNGALHVWGESLSGYQSTAAASDRSTDSNIARESADPQAHPFACKTDELHAALQALSIEPNWTAADAIVTLRLPRDHHGPWPSDRLARRTGAIEAPIDPYLGAFSIPAIAIQNGAALPALMHLGADEHSPDIELAHSMRYWIAVAELIIDLLQNQRFVPSIQHLRGNVLQAAWQPWLADDDSRRRLATLLRGMPPVVRATIDHHQSQPTSILDEAIRTITDSTVREWLRSEQFIDAIEDRDPASDPHVAWLSGLLDLSNQVGGASTANGSFLHRDAMQWLARLDDQGQGRPLRLCLKLNEPPAGEDIAASWTMTIHLQSPDDPHLLIDAAAIWSGAAETSSAVSGAASNLQAQELLLSELGRASRVYPKLDVALSEKTPTDLELTTPEAYEFLRDIQSVLQESGVEVIVPEWWDQPLGRLSMRLHVEAPPAQAPTSDGTTPATSVLGLNTIVNFRWQIAIGDQPLTAEEFAALAQHSGDSPLVRVRGRWIELNAEQIAQARELLRSSPSGEMTLLEAIQIAHGVGSQPLQLPVHGLDASGWIADFLAASGEEHRMPLLDQPPNFKGDLRPYQKSGLSWMAFLDQYGLGACLADDMGLGKTIQLIALLLHERERTGARTPPTLLVVPTSVIANWVRELERFAPSLKAHVQHGPDRPVGDRFAECALKHDLVITTYPLISRDIESLKRVEWHRVALDEAQYIKNPPTKQTTAIRSLRAPHRLALTGTPVENRLSELWSIMEFCNPGYLGSAPEFRRRFGVPIERHHNRLQADRLRDMVRPFVLRRVKTDPKVISDLPDCTETKEFATLTVEQAAMYQEAVNAMLHQVDRAEGIQRRGLVLATLVKLKQICNHPAQAAKEALQEVVDTEESNDTEVIKLENALSSRSGKAKRLMVMLEEVIASGEKALIFTQFRQMGHLLGAMIRSDLDCETLFLHGGTPAAKRQGLIDRFQSDSGGVPIFILSLKAGGLGLNLTAANHVFHYDRWWNPAVENQATDRAFRIGQMRAVQVHKFVCLGTLEERIDQMIEQKTDLAQNIIGSGEQWLTELSTNQLHDLLMLRPSAMEGES